VAGVVVNAAEAFLSATGHNDDTMKGDEINVGSIRTPL
jgi:hypothetical protein